MAVTALSRVEAVPASPRRVTILGSTGSIGHSTIDLLLRNRDGFTVEAVTANRNATLLAEQARKLGARFAAVADPAEYGTLKDALAGSGIEAASGPGALIEAAERPADMVMAGIVGSAGLGPTLAAVRRGRIVAFANKEVLVCAGNLFMQEVATHGATLLPVDSEHNAIWQCFDFERVEGIEKITLTCSGGPFREKSVAEMREATVQQAVNHPTWNMGAKISIDSATLMNKGLEIIEAHHLFDVPAAMIDVFVHPQSIVHGMVEFRDGSMVAQLGPTDMRVPIAHCLAWPDRIDAATRLDFARLQSLTFEAPDPERFPALRLARLALEAGGGAPTVLNAANEVAVGEFLERRIGFAGIPALVEATIGAAAVRGMLSEPSDVEDALAIDHNARSLARDLVPQIALKAS
jgi:1-deoxy-D-xylulose-5-phosphate reductoisomerase